MPCPPGKKEVSVKSYTRCQKPGKGRGRGAAARPAAARPAAARPAARPAAAAAAPRRRIAPTLLAAGAPVAARLAPSPFASGPLSSGDGGGTAGQKTTRRRLNSVFEKYTKYNGRDMDSDMAF
jgi:hypothetical protein